MPLIPSHSAPAEEYARTDNKKPAPGVEVKLFKRLDYDAGEALAWARSKQMCLVPEALNIAAFKKIAQATPLPFVFYHEEPQVTIATKLDEALAKAKTLLG